jgi:hypothetical protein
MDDSRHSHLSLQNTVHLLPIVTSRDAFWHLLQPDTEVKW